jgi:VanZ family protein
MMTAKTHFIVCASLGILIFVTSLTPEVQHMIIIGATALSLKL